MASNIFENVHSTKHAGKVALITGGSSGIGLATAIRLAREGAAVYITGRRQAELDTAVTQIGHGAVAVRGDITSAADLARIVEIVSAKNGQIDILFANAGGGDFTPLNSVTEAQFDKIFDINVKGTLLTVQAALPLMPKGSAIAITGSAASAKGTPAFGVYAATKAALRSFARTFASDLKGSGIRVNVVAPGVFITPAYKNELKMSDEQIEGYSQISRSRPRSVGLASSTNWPRRYRFLYRMTRATSPALNCLSTVE